jgi:transcriptional regulator with XRE-family HTH domain
MDFETFGRPDKNGTDPLAVAAREPAQNLGQPSQPPRRQQLPLVGQRIRQLRKDRGLTQAELAAKVSIQQSDLCRMETGEYKVSLETLFKILKIFEMNVGEFFHEAPAGEVTANEAELLADFRGLPPAAQDEVRHFIKFLERQPRKNRRRG